VRVRGDERVVVGRSQARAGIAVGHGVPTYRYLSRTSSAGSSPGTWPPPGGCPRDDLAVAVGTALVAASRPSWAATGPPRRRPGHGRLSGRSWKTAPRARYGPRAPRPRRRTRPANSATTSGERAPPRRAADAKKMYAPRSGSAPASSLARTRARSSQESDPRSDHSAAFVGGQDGSFRDRVRGYERAHHGGGLGQFRGPAFLAFRRAAKGRTSPAQPAMGSTR